LNLEELDNKTLYCSHCNATMSDNDKFCGHCGMPLVPEKVGKERRVVYLIVAFYAFFLLHTIVSFFIYEEEITLTRELWVEGIFILSTIIFCLMDWKRILALFTAQGVPLWAWGISILFPIVTGFSVYYGMDVINSFLEVEDNNVFWEYFTYENPVLWAMIFYVLIPPIFEELAFRGFLFNQLRLLLNPTVTIIATAVLFALVHFSFVSMLWIFPFGMALGYLRFRFKTLWLGMIIHFIHNLIVVSLDYYYFDSTFFYEDLIF